LLPIVLSSFSYPAAATRKQKGESMGKGIPAATRFCSPCLARRPKAVGIAGPREEDDGEMELLFLLVIETILKGKRQDVGLPLGLFGFLNSLVLDYN
jgi:hypothetical protein